MISAPGPVVPKTPLVVTTITGDITRTNHCGPPICYNLPMDPQEYNMDPRVHIGRVENHWFRS